MKSSFETTNAFHHAARAFRNRLVVMAVIAVLASLLIVVIQWSLPDAAILQQPDGSTLSRLSLLLLVMLFGTTGAVLSAIPAVAAIPRVSSPFNFPLQQALLKIALGSLTAVVGVVALGSAGVTKGFSSLQALLGVAAVFG